MMMMGGSDRECLHKRSTRRTTLVASWASVYIEISKRLISEIGQISIRSGVLLAAVGDGPPPPPLLTGFDGMRV